MDAIMNRRATRKFQDKPVEKEKVEGLLRAAMQSPTGHDAQDWEFLVVTDGETRLKVSEMSPFTVCAKNAPLLIITMANLERAVKEEPLWQCDMGAVCQTLLIQAEDEGLGGTWLACYPHEGRMAYLRELFSLPEHIVPYSVMALGYKQYIKPMVDRFDPKKIHWEKF